MLKMAPYQLNKKFSFGTIKTVTSPVNGSQTQKFVPQFTLWGAYRTRSLTQQYAIQGTTLVDTILIVVRHNPKITKSFKVQVTDGKTVTSYDIVDISPDEGNYYITYDIITIKKTSK